MYNSTFNSFPAIVVMQDSSILGIYSPDRPTEGFIARNLHGLSCLVKSENEALSWIENFWNTTPREAKEETWLEL